MSPPVHWIDLLTALWIWFLGAAMGSFFSVVAYRMPQGKSIVWKPSHCPKCGHPIRAYDNIPVFGWLLLRGHCRDCRQPIPARYAIVELVMGLLFVILAYAELFSGGANLPGGPISQPAGAVYTLWTPVWTLIGLVAFHGGLLSLLMVLLLIDLDNYRVPFGIVVFALTLGLIPSLVGAAWIPGIGLSLSGATGRFAMTISSLVGLAAGGVMAVVIHRVMSRFCLESISRKPVNFTAAVAVIGLFLGWQAVVCITVVSSAVCLGNHFMLRNKQSPKHPVMLSLLMVATLAQIVFWKHLVVWM